MVEPLIASVRQSNMRASRKQWLLFSGVCFGLTLAALAYVGWGANRELRDFDPDWAAANIRAAAQIQEALERYQKDHGSYPPSLATLVPDYLAEIPAASTSHRVRPANDRWYYSREPDGQYWLCALAMHWVSSFDALVYSPSQQYPDAWRRECDCIDVDGWIYVVGFNQRLRCHSH